MIGRRSAEGGARVRPAATASRYHVACGSHCSPQRQSWSAPVDGVGRLKSIPCGSVKPGGDAVDDAAGRVRVLAGAEVAGTRGCCVPCPCSMRGVERVEAQDPVELVLGVAPEPRREGGVVGEVRERQARREGQRAQPRVLALPPGRGLGVVGEEEARVAHAVLRLHELARVAERVGDLGRDRQLPLERGAHGRQRAAARRASSAISR